ncbi:MAG: aldehyde dehydrogenase family protein [Candidatus Brockarchaeota archaeon]|nr:aldehyde dehydrogenase family protein [Candidatus Brockarchaeota archaeon]
MVSNRFDEVTLPKEFRDVYDEEDGVKKFRLFIGGKWIRPESGKYFDVKSPSTRRVLAKAALGSREEALQAISEAVSSQNKIRSLAAIDRIEILEEASRLIAKYEEYFVNILVSEAGKPIVYAKSEVKATRERMRLTLEEARKIYGEYIPGDWVDDTRNKFAIVLRQPVGVIATITPFNYPLFSPIAKIAPALVSGNCVVHKPASDTPIVSLLLARVLQAAGLPDGVLNVVTGPGGEVGDTIISDPRVGAVSFTGSTDVGSKIPAKAGIKKLHLELGGKAAAIVLEDVDLDLAAEKITLGVIKNSGQRCDAISRALVVEDIADKLVDKLKGSFEKVKFGYPWEDGVQVGPLINERALSHVSELVEDAVNKGALLLVGGKSHGLIYEPTLLDKVPLEARIAWEETFGPVLPVIRVKNEEEAIEISNRSNFGLDSAIFTNSFYRMWRIAKTLQVGTVSVNDAPAHGVGNFPFGGVKDSGMGREGLGYSIDEMTVIKTISVNLEPAGMKKEAHKC